MLELIEFKLRNGWEVKNQRIKIKTVKLVGSMNVNERRAVLKAFKSKTSGVSVILMSLKAGGEGLNLPEASHVFIIDPWVSRTEFTWNI